jgi:hypothetical protein
MGARFPSKVFADGDDCEIGIFDAVTKRDRFFKVWDGRAGELPFVEDFWNVLDW